MLQKATKFAKSVEELKEQLQLFSEDIHIQFGLVKCAKATFVKEHIQSSKNIEVSEAIKIKGTRTT